MSLYAAAELHGTAPFCGVRSEPTWLDNPAMYIYTLKCMFMHFQSNLAVFYLYLSSESKQIL